MSPCRFTDVNANILPLRYQNRFLKEAVSKIKYIKFSKCMNIYPV